MVISGLPDAVSQQLRGLDGARTRAQVLAAAPDGQRELLRTVLAELSRAGLVDDAVPAGTAPTAEATRLATDTAAWALRTGRSSAGIASRRSRSQVVVHGDGRVAPALGCLLAAAGVGWVHVATSGTVRPEDCGTGYLAADIGTSRALAAREALHRASASVRTAPVPAGTVPDLAIVTDTAVPDPTLVSTLTAAGTAHLTVRVREGTGWVGPLVVPGRTSCLRCLDLHRTERDPCWPRVAAQLAASPQAAELNATQAAAAFAAGPALRYLDGDGDALWNSMIELDPVHGVLGRRSWQPHPACGCQNLAAARVSAQQAAR